MSGTSADGLTVCAVRIQPFEVLAFKNYKYPPALQQKLLRAYMLPASALGALHYELGALYARRCGQFLKTFNFSAAQIEVAGMHG